MRLRSNVFSFHAPSSSLLLSIAKSLPFPLFPTPPCSQLQEAVVCMPLFLLPLAPACGAVAFQSFL